MHITSPEKAGSSCDVAFTNQRFVPEETNSPLREALTWIPAMNRKLSEGRSFPRAQISDLLMWHCSCCHQSHGMLYAFLCFLITLKKVEWNNENDILYFILNTLTIPNTSHKRDYNRSRCRDIAADKNDQDTFHSAHPCMYNNQVYHQDCLGGIRIRTCHRNPHRSLRSNHLYLQPWSALSEGRVDFQISDYVIQDRATPTTL